MATATTVQKEKEGVAIKVKTPGDLSGSVVDRASESFDAISRRAFEIFESNGRLAGHDIEDWLNAERELFHPVHIEISESDESISVKAEVPGFNENELQVSVKPQCLTISGKRESSKEQKRGKTVYSETCSNEIFRFVDLPAAVDTAKVIATLNNGMLQLTMPKATKAVQIQPKVAAQPAVMGWVT